MWTNVNKCSPKTVLRKCMKLLKYNELRIRNWEGNQTFEHYVTRNSCLTSYWTRPQMKDYWFYNKFSN